jgi:phosphoglucomutase
LPALLDEIFAAFGVYLERGESLTMDGAAGAASIKALVESYSKTPPTEIDGTKVTSVVNFATDVIHDVEGDRIPSEAMLMITLADGRRIAVRPSGTEPKIKYYMFAVQKPTEGKTFEVAEIASIKDAVAGKLASLWSWLSADADRRLGKA